MSSEHSIGCRSLHPSLEKRDGETFASDRYDQACDCHPPFLVVQLFDRETPQAPGRYYTSIISADPKELRAKAAARSERKGMVACSIPFAGTWNGGTRDVSLPLDFKQALASVDRMEE